MWGAGAIVDAARINRNPAITRGSTVYVDRTKGWSSLQNPADPLVWSEVVHTAQHAFSGSLDSNWSAGFLGSILMKIDGIVTPRLGWDNNIVEQTAHRVGAELAAAWNAGGSNQCR